MASIKQQFEIPAGLKKWSLSLIGIGIVSIIVGFITKGRGTEAEQAEFIGTLMYNTIFWTLVCNASMFFICITTLAMGAWQVSFRRIPEAISTLVPVFGSITLAILLFVVWSGNTSIYHWIHPHDAIIQGKSGFLNVQFFTIWSILAVGLWSLLGWRMRVLSREADSEHMDKATGASFIWRNTVSASLFLVWFALTVGSTIPWLWLMSLDAHWYSTMYSWYTFASSFVSGMSLVALWFIYLKNRGYLEFSTQEHLHDVGKFMFAFSIFWTYLWFSQFMLIWYSNQPEETIYFKPRFEGEYRGIFFLNLIMNFVCPILILMKRGAKRNYTLITFMAVLIIFGHWIDFYQMVMASVRKESSMLSWLDFGVLSFFVGTMILLTARSLASKPLVPKHHPFLKESVIHHT